MFAVLVAVTLLTTGSSSDKQYTALQFGTSNSDYIAFNYDMSPFRDSLTLCTWIKRVYTGASHPVVFNYKTSSDINEMYIGARGIYNMVVGDTGLNNLQSKFTTPAGSWFSYCISWSLASRRIKLYLNGDLIGTDQDTGRTLYMGGTLWFNRYAYSGHSSYVFGGELYQFNLYSNELSSTSIKKIAEGGLCFDLEEFSETRVLRWEDILDRSRSGTVREVTGCGFSELQLVTRLSKSQEKLAAVTGRLSETEVQLSRMEERLETVTDLLNSTQEELESSQLNFTEVNELLDETKERLQTTEEKLEAVTEDLNKTEATLETVTGRLNSTEEDLGAVRGELGRTENQLQTEAARHNKTVERLETCSATLTDSQRQLEDARTFQNITRWDVLYTDPYFNKEFSEELFQKLTSSWDMLRKFVGVNITEGVVQHFRQYHREPVCDVFEQLSSTMLIDFVGVEWTMGIVDHFKDTHEDTACDNDTES